MDETPRPRRLLGRLAFIGFLILLLFTAVLYALGGFPGNDTQTVPAGSDQTSAAGCTENPALAQAIDDARGGAVAAVLPAEPQPMGGLAFDGPDGTSVSLADFRGRTVLLNLWATWCVPCREEMPALNALEQQIGGDDFEVVAVSIDRGADDKPKAFLQEVGAGALGFYHDPAGETFNAMKAKGLALGLPVTAIVDADGCLRASLNGPADWSSPEAVALLDVVRGGERPVSPQS